MADSIQFRRGLRSTVKPLPVGMPGFVEDEERLVIGKGDGTNAELPNKADMDNVDSQMAEKANKTDLDVTNENIGDKSQLNTNDKSNIVKAVNEVKGQANTTGVGLQTTNNTLSSLQTQVTNMASGSPKGTYDTLSNLQTAYPTGTTGIFIITNDIDTAKNGHWYYWNGLAWTDGGAYQSTGIANADIIASKLRSDTSDDFIKLYKSGSNKFNFYDCTVSNDVVLIGNGTTTGLTGWNVISGIKLKPSQQYTLSSAIWVSAVAGNRGAQYDKNGNFIASIDSTTFTTASNCYSVSFTVDPSVYLYSVKNSFAIFEGSVAGSYDGFKSTIPDDPRVFKNVSTKDLQDDAVTPDKTSFLKQGINQFNPILAEITDNSWVIYGDVQTGKTGYFTVKYPVKPTTTYTLNLAPWGTMSAGMRICQYDKYGVRLMDSDNATFTTHDYSDYIIFSVDKNVITQWSLLNTLMLVIGTSVGSYVPYYCELDDGVITNIGTKQLALITSLSSKTIYIGTKYTSGQDLWKSMEPAGHNGIPQLNRLWLVDNPSKYVFTSLFSPSFPPHYQSTSDWVSPINGLRAINNGDGVNPNNYGWSGGQHGFDYNGTTFPTASNTIFKVYADNKLLSADFTGYAEEIKVVEVNMLMGLNTIKADGTGRNVLQETRTYTFKKDGTVSIEVELQMLEDISISQYPGIQAEIHHWKNKILFVDDTKYKGYIDYTATHTDDDSANAVAYSSGTIADGSTVHELRMANLTGDNLIANVDPTYGLGKYKYVASTAYPLMIKNYGKSYFNLISSWTQFSAGQVLRYRASYWWYSD